MEIIIFPTIYMHVNIMSIQIFHNWAILLVGLRTNVSPFRVCVFPLQNSNSTSTKKMQFPLKLFEIFELKVIGAKIYFIISRQSYLLAFDTYFNAESLENAGVNWIHANFRSFHFNFFQFIFSFQCSAAFWMARSRASRCRVALD